MTIDDSRTSLKFYDKRNHYLDPNLDPTTGANRGIPTAGRDKIPSLVEAALRPSEEL